MPIRFADLTAVENLKRLEGRMVPALTAIASAGALELESYMKQNRPWTDRTGRAKASLFAVVSQPDSMVIRTTLGHGVSYGKWLELAHSQKYAVVIPTMRSKSKEYFQHFLDFVDKVKL